MSVSVLDFDAFIVDLDGVLTDTGALHARAWKRTFDDYLKVRAPDRRVATFHLSVDYGRFVHGKCHAETVREFLASREVALDEADDRAQRPTATADALSRTKSEHFRRLVEERGVHVHAGSRQFLDYLKTLSRPTALVTSSRNGEFVLDRAGLDSCFDVIIDGRLLERERLYDKPVEASFQFAAAWLGKDPAWTAVVEATPSGVAAGRQGGFGCVVGVLRNNSHGALRAAGADIVVEDLAELLPSPGFAELRR